MTNTHKQSSILRIRKRHARIPCLLLALVTLTPVVVLGQTIPLKFEPAEPLPKRLFLFNTDLLTAIAFNNVGYESPQFEDAIRKLRPQGLRFPGGTIANHYRWEEDSFSDPASDKTEWAAEQLKLFRQIGRPYDFPGFANVVQRNRLTPIWVLNVFEESPESVLGLFEKMEASGIHVQAVEMANEPYWDGRTIDDVLQYIRLARPIAESLKQRYPHVRIGACFAPLENQANYEVLWNQPLAKEQWFDAIVYHDYYGGQGFSMEEGRPIPADAMLRPEAMIERPLAAFEELSPGTPIWLTEWNVGPEGLAEWRNKGAELQFIAATFISLMEHRNRIQIACFHAFCDSQFGPMFIDSKSSEAKRNASFELFQMLGTALAGAKHLRPIVFSSNDLRGFATQCDDDIRIFILNRSQQNQVVRLPTLCTGDLIQQSIDCRPDRELAKFQEIADSSTVTNRTTVLPANSISLIGRRQTLEFDSGLEQKHNLLLSPPALELWHAPFASEQPKFDTNDIYTVDLEKIKQKSVAVVTLDLDNYQLESDREYLFEFASKTDGQGGVLIVKLPSLRSDQATQPNSMTLAEEHSIQLTREFSTNRFRLKLGQTKESKKISFVFPQATIRPGARVSLGQLRLTRTD